MREIAVYGKGGIGKSTLSANLSAAMALQGKRVLQIGCDPKHDSTRLLMGGRRITTVLDYIRDTPALDYRLEDVLFTGFSGIGCIEAGGPKPGVGCAGRGIITAFELLEKFHIKENYDIILYDVLGDVVCGGFAVPIRREYADTIFLVTSGEYMSLYAANNILRGIKNYDDDQRRVAGILYNSRSVKGEDARVSAFAQAVGLPIFARIPRDDVFARAEKHNCTIPELRAEEDSQAVGRIFAEAASKILAGPALFPAKPLEDEELEALIFSCDSPAGKTSGFTAPAPSRSEGGFASAGGAASEPCQARESCDLCESCDSCDPCESHDSCDPCESRRPLESFTSCDSCDSRDSSDDGSPAAAYDAGYLSKNVIRDEPLHGCAFNGAMNMSIHLRDAVILAHSPKSCTYLSYQSISSSGRRRLFERGTLLPAALAPNIVSTDMTESDMVFGGTEKLLDAVDEIRRRLSDARAIVIISSCPSGIIGDDIDKAKALSTPELPVVTIKTDGNLAGDYLQGMLMAYTQLAKQVIDPAIRPSPKVVNIVFEKVIAKNTESNFQTIKGYLAQMGVSVNCRFLCDTTFDALKNFCSASLNLLAYKDYTGKLLEDFFSREYGCRFYPEQFPVGFAETERWLRGVGAFFGEEDTAEDIIADHRQIYEARIRAVKPFLQGKRLMVITYNHNLDWILKTALDAGMEIVKLCILNFSQDEGFRSALPEADSILLEENYDRADRQKDIQQYQPDIVLSNYESSATYASTIADTIPMCPDNGFFSGLVVAERWANLFHMNLEGEWKNDQPLFDKYYTR